MFPKHNHTVRPRAVSTSSASNENNRLSRCGIPRDARYEGVEAQEQHRDSFYLAPFFTERNERGQGGRDVTNNWQATGIGIQTARTPGDGSVIDIGWWLAGSHRNRPESRRPLRLMRGIWGWIAVFMHSQGTAFNLSPDVSILKWPRRLGAVTARWLAEQVT